MAVPPNGAPTPLSAHAYAIAGDPLTWIVVGALLLAVLAVSWIRVVPAGERLAVFRLGRYVGIKGPGLVVVPAGIVRAVRIPMRPVHVDLLWVEATTRDQVTVMVNGVAMASVNDPVAYAVAEDSSAAATSAAAETEVRRYVAERDLAELSAPDDDGVEELAARISRRTAHWGVEVRLVELTRIEIPLRADLIRWAENFPSGVRQPARGRDEHA
ncbi:SPFH domain-containing protein [Nonomuraea sp. NPDC048916]|uniref:SPFH domain-containing protein n=1 Tax=Nonomuraea sp. NPDC048916 TaxID=3154232 RepID=UPI0033C29674